MAADIRLVLMLPFARGAEAKEIHHDVSDDGKVVGGEAGAHGGPVFVELHVEAPVESVLRFPMAAHRMSNALGVSRQRTDVVASLATGLAPTLRSRSTIAKLFRSSHCSALWRRFTASNARQRRTSVRPWPQSEVSFRNSASTCPHAGLGEHNGVDELGVVVPTHNTWSAPPSRICRAMFVWVPIASIVTTQPPRRA